MSQSQKLSISPVKSQQPFFPTISYKTSESPSKVMIPLANNVLFEQKHDKISLNHIRSAKLLKQDKAKAIYKYLQSQILKTKDLSHQKTKNKDKTLITDSTDTIQNSKESSSSFQQLKTIQEKHSKQLVLGKSQSYKDLTVERNSYKQVQNQCIVEVEQEQEDYEQKFTPIIKNQLKISSNQYNNYKDDKILRQQKVVLDFNQQNKEYKIKNIQILQMIKNAQQRILKQRNEDIQEQEKEYKTKKIQRQKERKEGLHNAQLGLKNRQLKSLLNALKGSQIQNYQDHQVLNIARKFHMKRSQSTIMSRQDSFQQSNQDYFNKQFNEKLPRKYSQVSDFCSSETSQDSIIQIQTLLKQQKSN